MAELDDRESRRDRPPVSDRQRRQQRLETSRLAVRLFREQGCGCDIW